MVSHLEKGPRYGYMHAIMYRPFSDESGHGRKSDEYYAAERVSGRVATWMQVRHSGYLIAAAASVLRRRVLKTLFFVKWCQYAVRRVMHLKHIQMGYHVDKD